MKPHDQNLERYGKLCRERTHKSMTKSRQIQVCFVTFYAAYLTVWLFFFFLGSNFQLFLTGDWSCHRRTYEAYARDGCDVFWSCSNYTTFFSTCFDVFYYIHSCIYQVKYRFLLLFRFKPVLYLFTLVVGQKLVQLISIIIFYYCEHMSC